MSDRCDKCGHPFMIGDWPFCPHGESHGGAIRDDIPGGVLLENYGPHPVRVYSHSERKRLMAQPRIDPVTGKEYRLSEFVRHVGVPGTDKSPHTTDWGKSMDPYTLEAARALVSRVCAPDDGGESERLPDITVTPSSIASVHSGIVTDHMLANLRRHHGGHTRD